MLGREWNLPKTTLRCVWVLDPMCPQGVEVEKMRQVGEEGEARVGRMRNCEYRQRTIADA